MFHRDATDLKQEPPIHLFYHHGELKSFETQAKYSKVEYKEMILHGKYKYNECYYLYIFHKFFCSLFPCICSNDWFSHNVLLTSMLDNF